MMLKTEAAAGFAMAGEAGALDAWMNLLGRLHPLMVHFPVALVIVAALVELWRAVRRHEGPSPFARVAVWFAAVFGIAAASSGWANAAYGGDSASVSLFLHRWGGVAVAVMLVALAIAGTQASRAGHAAWSGLWRMGLVFCAGLVAAVGHFGGNLVHGEGYVTRALWSALDASLQPSRQTAGGVPAGGVPAGDAPASDVRTDGANASDEHTGNDPPADARPNGGRVAVAHVGAVGTYADILPIFERHCFDCHGGGKQKAGIRLDDPVSMIGQQRKGRTMVKPGDPAGSSLLTVLTLPVDDELAMPPEGDRLSAAEIARVRAWIVAGAPVGGASAADPR